MGLVRTPHYSVAPSPKVNPIVRLKKLPEDSRHGLLGSAKQISPVSPPNLVWPDRRIHHAPQRAAGTPSKGPEIALGP